MKKVLISTLSIIYFIFYPNIHVTAQVYESDGQASFYGVYEYEDDIKPNDPSLNQPPGTDVFLPDGQEILPRTGDYVNPVYLLIGIILIAGAVGLVICEKRRVIYEK